MPRARYFDVATDPQGRPIPHALVDVFDEGTTIPIAETIFAGPTGPGTQSNPITANAQGEMEIWLADMRRVSIRWRKDGYVTESWTVDVLSVPSTTSGGHTIEDEGIPLPQRTSLNFVGAGVVVTDDAGNDETDVTIPGGSGHTIKEDGGALPARTGLNFVDGLLATDDAGNDETDVNLDYATTEIADVAAAESPGVSAKSPRGDHVHAHGTGYLPDAHHGEDHVLATGTALGTHHSVSGAAVGEVLRALSATTAAFDQLLHADLGGVSADQHHTEDHVLATGTALGTHHSISGAAVGEVLRALSVTTAAFDQLQHTDLGSVTADQHHTQSHVLATGTALGPDHTISGAAAGEFLRALSATTAAFDLIQASDLPAGTSHTHDGTGGALSLVIGGLNESGATVPTATTEGSIAIGDYANAGTDTEPIAIGSGADATLAPSAIGRGAIAIGASTAGTGVTGPRALGEGSIAIGHGRSSAGNTGPSVTEALGIAIGRATLVTGEESVALGPYSNVTGGAFGAVAFGSSASASGNQSLAIGPACSVSGVEAVAVGSGSTSTGDQGASIGASADSDGAQSTAIGFATTSGATRSVALGGVANCGSTDGMAIGGNAQSNTGTGAMAIGGGSTSARAANVTGDGGIGIGGNSGTANGSRAAGAQAIAVGSGITGAAGASASGAQSIALGRTALASAADGIAIGRTATASNARSIALGQGAATTAVDQIMMGTSARQVHIPGTLRIPTGAVLGYVLISDATGVASWAPGTRVSHELFDLSLIH